MPVLYPHLKKSGTDKTWPEYEHIDIATRALGHALPKGAEVHHVNSNKYDNRRSNLVICQNHAYHALLHARTRVVQAGGNPNTDKICARCRLVKPQSEFHAAYCRPCESDFKRRRYKPTDHPRRRKPLSDGTVPFIERMSSLVGALESRAVWRFVDLAQHLNVCTRTLRRDLLALEASGVRIGHHYRACWLSRDVQA